MFIFKYKYLVEVVNEMYLLNVWNINVNKNTSTYIHIC